MLKKILLLLLMTLTVTQNSVFAASNISPSWYSEYQNAFLGWYNKPTNNDPRTIGLVILAVATGFIGIKTINAGINKIIGTKESDGKDSNQGASPIKGTAVALLGAALTVASGGIIIGAKDIISFFATKVQTS